MARFMDRSLDILLKIILNVDSNALLPAGKTHLNVLALRRASRTPMEIQTPYNPRSSQRSFLIRADRLAGGLMSYCCEEVTSPHFSEFILVRLANRNSFRGRGVHL